MAQTIVEKIAQATWLRGRSGLCVPVISFPSGLFM
jgi:hypothetical protein